MKKQLLSGGKLFALSCIYVSVMNAAFAADEPQTLGEVSVYGERPAAFRNITTSTEAATKALIESTNVINTEDAVKYLPSIQIRKRFIGDRNAILSSRNAGTIDSARSLVYADNVLVPCCWATPSALRRAGGSSHRRRSIGST